MLERLSPIDSPVFALQRVSADGQDVVLVLANTDIEKDQALTLALDPKAGWPQPVPSHRDTVETPRPALPSLEELLGQSLPKIKQTSDGKVTATPYGPYGLAWFIDLPDRKGVAWHGGVQPGATSMLFILPKERFALVILTNLEGGGYLQLETLLNQIADIMR